MSGILQIQFLIFLFVVFHNLTLCAKKFGLDVDVTIGGRDIEDVYEDANDKFQEQNAN